jgi:hypothetical protein
MKAKKTRQKKLVIDDLKLQEIQNMAGRGLTNEQIAHYYGITPMTLYNMKKRDERIVERLRKGKSQAIITVSGRLMQAINEGNVTAMIFYLKTQAGWKENSTVEKDTNHVKSKNSDYKIDTMDAIEASKIYQSIMTGSYNNVGNRSSK